MKILELKHIAPYLPYKVKCQYVGIINVENFNKMQSIELLIDKPVYDSIYGNKIAEIKDIKFRKHYFSVYIGKYTQGLKCFTNGYDFKLILHPLSDLLKPCLLDGKIPYNELEQITTGYHWTNSVANLLKYPEEVRGMWPQYILEKLFEWHFDVFGLIEKGLAIDINTIK